MKIEVLYPEICNLYGDLMNAEYLARSAGAELVRTSLKEQPAFTRENIDLVYMGCTTEQGQLLARDALRPYMDAIRKRIDDSGATLVTGNALEIFGEYIDADDGEKIEMLGLFPTYAKRRLMERHNSFYVGEFDGEKVVGFKSQFGHSYGNPEEGLFATVKGVGLNPETPWEGLRRENFMATYLIGPVAVMNPPFAKSLLVLMGAENVTLAHEEAAMEVYETRVREFLEPERKAEY